VQRGSETQLRLNDGQGIHSIYDPDNLDYDGPWQQFLAGTFFNTPPRDPADVQRIAIVGLAAGTFARQATAVYGDIPIDGFEIDPKIIAVGERYFGMASTRQPARYAEDGRWSVST